MKYQVFATEQEAIDAEAQIAQTIGCIKIGTNAKTGLPAPDAQVTERWAIPQQIQDGRWVFESPDDEGEVASPDWFYSEEATRETLNIPEVIPATSS